MNKFSAKISEKLKYYVYLYVDPRDNLPFYIGKGKANRVFAHLSDTSESEKVKVIEELRKLGKEPVIELLKYGLTEDQALLVEATAIDLLNVKNLTNRSRGHGSRFGARSRVEEVVAQLDAKPAKISEPALLININRAFRYGMTQIELYDATRSAWVLGQRRNRVKYALSIYRGIVREVYEVVAWLPGGATMRGGDHGRREPFGVRWEFVGAVAEDTIRNKYLGKSVTHLFSQGAQNPIMYVNCGAEWDDE